MNQKNPEQLAEAILKIKNDKELTERIRKKGREKIIEKFDIEKNVKKLIEIFEKDVGENEPLQERNVHKNRLKKLLLNLKKYLFL